MKRKGSLCGWFENINPSDRSERGAYRVILLLRNTQNRWTQRQEADVKVPKAQQAEDRQDSIDNGAPWEAAMPLLDITNADGPNSTYT